MVFSLGVFSGSYLARQGVTQPHSSGSGNSSSKVTNQFQPDPIYTDNDWLLAIQVVESGGNANAVGDNGNAVGAYQIWKIYVDDVNRILKEDVFVYKDRCDKVKSANMALVYTKFYTGIAEWNKPYFPPTQMDRFEAMARIHNGGPTGYKKECTKAYWVKVKAELEKSK